MPGFFDFFSKKEEPAAPEKRVVPDFVSASPNREWIAGQVFVGKNNSRTYYAAGHLGGDRWQIIECYYSLKDQKDPPVCTAKMIALAGDIKEALLQVAALDKEHTAEGFETIAGLEANYREVAHAHALHFDEQGKLIAITQDKPLSKEAFFNRKTLNALFAKKAKQPTAAPVIATWDDFHREVVQKNPLEPLPAGLPLPNYYPGLAASSAEMLEHVKAFETFMEAGKVHEKKQALASFLWRYELQGINCPQAIAYQSQVVLVTSLMRAGAKIYQHFLTSVPASEEDIDLLKKIGHKITDLAERHLQLPPEQAQQLADVIARGPDPYAAQPLPLEVFLKNSPAVPNDSKAEPKNYPQSLLDLPKSRKSFRKPYRKPFGE